VQITASAVSLTVEDVPASSAFLTEHFGFRQEIAADGFASLAREDAGMHVAFLHQGLEILPDDQRDKHATGLTLAFTVDNLEGELARLRAEGVVITVPLTVEDWGERFFQVTDPNGVIVQLMDWAARPGALPPAPDSASDGMRRHAETRRFAMRWPSPKRIRWRTPRTRRGWLITVAGVGASLAIKLTIGVGVVLLLLRHFLH
jgi:uncharacterized glyoxalase superfamily protein PhnB